MKILSWLLVLAMLLSFAACGTPADPVETDGAATDSTTPEETTTADTMDIQTGDAYYTASDYLPTETFNGEEIHIWVDGGDGGYNYPEERLIEGDIVQAAVLDRNAAVEDTYDVVFNWNRQWTGGYRNQAELRQSILAGDEYDIIAGPTLYLCPQLVYGCFYELSQNEYIDFSQPWWIAEATKTQYVYDKIYTASGYFDFPTLNRIQVYYFSDPLVLDYRLGNLYSLVEDDEWTWDKMIEMCEIVSEDVNQDGVMDGADRFGLSGRWDAWAAEIATSGYQYISRDENGEYVITGVTEELLELSDKIYPTITGTDVYFTRYTYGVHPKYPAELNNEGRTMFTNNQILFYMEGLGQTGTDAFRNYGAYGILPPPKYLDSQEGYGSAASSYSSAICTTTGDLKITSIVLEALQIESYNILRPAYTVDALSYKYLSDPQAVAMLQLIFANVTTDWSYNFANAGLGMELWRSVPTQQYLGSYFQKNKAAIEQKMADFLASVDSMQ